MKNENICTQLDILSRNPITLRSKDPNVYRNDVLAKVIPRILNPLGKLHIAIGFTYLSSFIMLIIFSEKRKFYDDPLNCPSWFPSTVKFRRPNHPKRKLIQ